LIVLFNNDVFLEMVTDCVWQVCSAIRVWVVYAWLDVSSEAWTNQARMEEWVTTRYLTL